ncbi:MAG: pentapeptide repeat-containing protein [Sulfurimicrobium sp.]|nr:pentapeptide repeat-containing protein [Sulfurimicrobium sp.]
MSHRQLWYVRRGDKVSGPFPTQVVANDTLLGRFLPGDEVSLDQFEWKPLVTVTELLPQELLELHDETDPEHRQWLEERLKAAHRWADQRTHEERRHAGEVAGLRGDARRQTDMDSEILALPHHHAALPQESGLRRYLGVAVGIGALLLLVALGLFYYQPVNPVKVGVVPVQPQCGRAAAPGVNWSGCDKQGVLLRGVDLTRGNLDYANFSQADLSGSRFERASLVGANLNAADLNHADLSNADLSNADLSAANLVSANLTGAVLAHAIWTDGRVCAVGSLGQCR